MALTPSNTRGARWDRDVGPFRSEDTLRLALARPRSGARRVLAVSRVVIGFTFLWAFLDKLFGFGFATPSSRAWINGGTPAQGFIKNIDGPSKDVFQIFANPFGDWLFMAGLLGIGVAMIAEPGCVSPPPPAPC